VRADAARNLETVLATGARLLADDPSTSIAAVATAAGVDRRTIYRRFASRDELLAAVYEARLDAVERAMDAARLTEAPVTVALHRYAEGIIAVNRAWPIDLRRMRAEPTIRERRGHLTDRVRAFLRRAAEEGVLRPDVPPDWAAAVLRDQIRAASDEFPDLPPARAADLVVGTFLTGTGVRTGG
jgi:AcrR family transcriptional regulator